MTAVAMGTATTNGTTGCPKVLNVTLAGATSSSWATDAIVKLATAIKTDSDGYKITIEMSANTTVTATGKWMGGCLAVGTSNPVACFWGKSILTKASQTGAYVQYTDLEPSYTTYKNYSTTAAIASTTAITQAKWYMTMDKNDCSATQTLTSNGNNTATCAVTSFTQALAYSTTTSWFQPKEISTKIYTTLTRFSAKESATWTGMADTGFKHSSGCTAKALTGASALVAGAAVAFSAAALAF